MGMTDAQFKAYLLEQLSTWKRIKALTVQSNNAEIMREADEQIEKFCTALKF